MSKIGVANPTSSLEALVDADLDTLKDFMGLRPAHCADTGLPM